MTPAERQQFAKHAINEAMELCHRRWMLRVIWELREGAWTFRALQARCGDLSPTVLNQRLTELRDAGLVDTAEGGYRLTALGREMVEAFTPLSKWAVRWRKARG
ncbi:MAG: helix-turn-helix transcriptional regulator [Betaproteobacteria bacterium]|jgi:DNA-binding HxlR family transcriptional regulator|nr:MAG: helix-turn-helix transcriptional regulator [Betaproteobacteria bacterium]TMH32242.1 MAG: helix-turn-helix transcriptional regulator [Betaproteobacteria bacterium]